MLRLFACAVFPAVMEVVDGLRPGGKFESKAGVEEASGDDTAAFEEEFSFSSEKEGPDFQHGLVGG